MSQLDPEVVAGIALVRQVNDLERAGDAIGALDLMEEHHLAPDGSEMWGAARATRLFEVAVHQPLLPPWAWGRWLRAQALCDLDRPGSARVGAALADARRARLEGATGAMPCPDEFEMECRTRDHDWAYAQAYLYPYGGLRAFLTRRASDELVSRAPGVEDWATTPMGAFRLLRDDAYGITWWDISAEAEVGTINLGAAADLETGEHVIGRRVTCGGVALFDTAPLRVPEHVALAVASDPSDWVRALGERGDVGVGPRVRPGAWTGGPSGLLTDLPDSVWQDLARDACGSSSDDRRDASTSCLEQGALTLAARALDGATELRGFAPMRDPWPAVAAALQMPGVWARLTLSALDDPDPMHGASDFARLSQRLGGVARTLCWASIHALVEERL